MEFPLKRALVTGGAGFIGSHIVDALLKKGLEVAVLDDLSSGRKSNLDYALSQYSSKCSFILGSINDREALAKVSEFAPDTIYHLAAQMDVRKSVVDPVADAEANIVGTINLLETAVRASCKRIIFSSTGGAIYGNQDIFPAPESHATRPESQYGVSKLCAEHYLDLYSRTHNFLATSLRFSNVYGPRQNPHGEAGVVAIFCEKFFSGKTLNIFGDGKQTRDFVYVKDVVQACLLAALRPETPNFAVYNVGTGVEKSVIDLVQVYRESAASFGVDKVTVEHKPARAGEQFRSVIDPSFIFNSLKWKPEVTFEAGIRETIASFK